MSGRRASDAFERLYDEHADALLGFLTYQTATGHWPRTSSPTRSSAS